MYAISIHVETIKYVVDVFILMIKAINSKETYRERWKKHSLTKYKRRCIINDSLATHIINKKNKPNALHASQHKKQFGYRKIR